MINRKAVQKTILIASIGILLLSACGSLSSAPTNLAITATENTPENKPSQEASDTATPTHTPMSEAVSIYVDPDLPSAFKNSLQINTVGFALAESENATAKLTFSSEFPISTWIYALVAPFPTEIGLMRWNCKLFGRKPAQPFILTLDSRQKQLQSYRKPVG